MAKLLRSNEPTDIERLRSEMNRIFSDALTRYWPTASVQTLEYPLVDLYNYDDELVAHIAVPGVDLEDLEVSATTDTLTINGSIPSENSENVIWQETFRGRFRRTFRLPVEINPDNVQASMVRGILKVTMPKADQARPRLVKIREDETVEVLTK